MKTLGRRPYFSREIQLAIAKAYLEENLPSRVVAEKFAPLSPTGKLSEAAVRRISNRMGERAA